MTIQFIFLRLLLLLFFFLTYRSQLSQYSSLDIGIAPELPLRESGVPKPYAMKSLGISGIYFKT